MSGFLIAHEGHIPPGQSDHLTLDWEEKPLDIECMVIRTRVQRLSKGRNDRSIYHTGLRATAFADDTFNTLRHLIARHIVRALDEMKANAHGIPPLAAYMYQPEKGDLYRRCEFIDGVWRRTETVHPQQPTNGFTISADVDANHVEMLCQTWENTNTEGRRLTQLLAELSISKAEGVPTRRYVP